MYGITSEVRKHVRDKIKKQKVFLNKYYIEIYGDKIPLISLVKNSFINSDKYIAEINHRVYSLYQYAKDHDLENIFFTLTLPSNWHKKRVIRLKNGKKRMVRNDNYQEIIDGVENNPKNASKQLSLMFKKILDDRSYKSIPSDKRIYFRVTEPHRDGTPHLHISFFIPKEYKDSFIKMLKRKFPDPLGKVIENVDNPVAYLMKYILKTFDDLRSSSDLTDLTYWYLYWGISRFYTSRTLISLDVYRVLRGKYTLLELTKMYKNKELTIWVDPKTNKILEIIDNNPFGAPIYKRPLFNSTVGLKAYEKVPNQWKNKDKKDEKLIPIETPEGIFYYKGNKVIKPQKIPSRMKDLQLINYYNSLDPDDINLDYGHFAVVHNELVKRDIIDEDLIDLNYAISLNDIYLDEIEIF